MNGISTIYNDLSRGHPKWCIFFQGKSPYLGKPRLLKYYIFGQNQWIILVIGGRDFITPPILARTTRGIYAVYIAN